MPRRRRRARANQLAAVPESAVMMAPSGKRDDRLPEDELGVECLGRETRPFFFLFPPFSDFLLERSQLAIEQNRPLAAHLT